MNIQNGGKKVVIVNYHIEHIPSPTYILLISAMFEDECTKTAEEDIFYVINFPYMTDNFFENVEGRQNAKHCYIARPNTRLNRDNSYLI